MDTTSKNSNDDLLAGDSVGLVKENLAAMNLSAINSSKSSIKDQSSDVKDDKMGLTEVNNNENKLQNVEIAEDNSDQSHTKPTILETEPSPASKKKKKSSSKSKKPKPTGFEDYYVDAPLTPAEHSEEQALYSASKSFHDRLLLAIARYTNRRKFDEFRLRVFDRFLAYGGFGTGMKAFQGRVDEKDPEMTPVDTALAKCKYHVKHETLQNSVVDFDAVVRGYLTSHLPNLQEMLRPGQFKICTNVIRNFLNYLLHHDVCPEYADQIYDAKKSCDLADISLFECARLAVELPGSFNKACSIILGGYYQDIYIEDPEQSKAYGIDPGVPREVAVKTFLTGLAALGTEAMAEAYNKQVKDGTVNIKNVHEGYLEVLSIQPPSNKALELYSLASQSALRPIGYVKFAHWRHPAGPYPEMTPEEVAEYKNASYDRPEYTMWLDIDCLPLMKPGTKIHCTYRETSFGMWYFDGVMSVLSPMYTWLENEGMIDWVVPKDLPYRARPGFELDADGAVPEEDNVDGGDLKSNKDQKKIKKEDQDSDDDVPHQFKNYEKGEDIILTL